MRKDFKFLELLPRCSFLPNEIYFSLEVKSQKCVTWLMFIMHDWENCLKLLLCISEDISASARTECYS